MKRLSNDNPKNKIINNEKEISDQNKDISLNEHNNNKNKNKKSKNEKEKKVRYTTNSPLDGENDSGFIRSIIFPYRYYLCSIFIKHGHISTKSHLFTKKFINVYNFICKLFDISSYLIMQKEFEILKSTILIGKSRDILDNNQKRNINELNFNVNMREYLRTKKYFFNIKKNNV